MDIRRCLLFVFLLPAALAACGRATPAPTEAPPAVSFEDAAELVLTEVVQQATIDHPVIVFGHDELLSAQDVLKPYEKAGYGPFPGTIPIEGSSWFFWIDDEPGAAFAHDNRFVLVSSESGELSVSEQQWWPVLNEEGLWVERTAYWAEANWIYSNVDYQPEPPSKSSVPRRVPGLARAGSYSISRLQTEGARVGLVINGWEQGETLEDSMATSSDEMHDLLEAADFDTTYYGPAQTENARMDGIDADENLGPGEQPWRMWLRQQRETLKSGDTMFLYLTGHGAVTDSGITAAGDVFEDALQAELTGFDPGVNIIVVIDSCHSGGFVDRLTNLVDLTITATDEERASYGDIDPPFLDDNRDDEGMEFTSGFVEDWQEIFTDNSLLTDVQSRGSRAGANLWRILTADSFISAREKDAAYAFGWTGPQLSFGGPATKSAAGYAADAQVRLIATEGEGACGAPSNYQTTLDVSVRDGEMSTAQPATEDLNSGSLGEAFGFLIESEDGNESYQGEINPETLEGSGTTTYIDSSGCETKWNFNFLPQEVDFQTGPRTGFSDGVTVPFADGLLLLETTPGQPNYFIQTLPSEEGRFQFNLIEIPQPSAEATTLDMSFSGQPPGVSFLFPEGTLELKDDRLAAGPSALPTNQIQAFPSGWPTPPPDMFVLDSQNRPIVLGEDALLRWDRDVNQVHRFDTQLFFPGTTDLSLAGASDLFLIPPDQVVIPGSETLILNLSQPAASSRVDLSEFGEVFDLNFAAYDPGLISISAQQGVYLIHVEDMLGAGTLSLPPKASNPATGPGPHGWLASGDGSPMLVHAEGSRLWAYQDGERFLVVDTGEDILDLQFYLAPTGPEAGNWPQPDAAPTPEITPTASTLGQHFGDTADDVVVCDTGDAIDDSDGDIQRFAFYLPGGGTPEVEVFTAASPLDSFQDFSYSLQVGLGQDGRFRVVIYEIHAGTRLIGELDENGVIEGTDGQVQAGEDSVRFAFPGFEVMPGDSVTVRSFHMEEEGAPRTCDISGVEPIRLP